MHDQVKVKEDFDEKTKQFHADKIRRFRTLYDELHLKYHQQDFSRDVLPLLNVLLEISPEQYTFFGYRRRILMHAWSEAASIAVAAEVVAANTCGEDSETPQPPPSTASTIAAESQKAADLESEYTLNTAVIMKDFKVYSAFVHRRWILQQMPKARQAELLCGELKKCESLLKLDERNFHAWGYRRWVTRELRGLSSKLYGDKEEWTFTTAKINQNFSNYSAWHNRAMLLEAMGKQLLLHSHATTSSTETSEALVPAAVEAFVAAVTTEIDLVVKAFYCDPNDQSAWLYAEFVLGLLRSVRSICPELYRTTLETVISSCTELAAECAADDDGATNSAVDSDATVASGAYVYWMQWKIVRSHVNKEREEEGLSGVTDALSADGREMVRSWGSEAEIVEKLVRVDSMRAGMYRALLLR